MKKVALISLGCAKNLVDSEVMLGYLDSAGYVLEPVAEKAEIVIVNTCGFIQPARKEALDTLRDVATLKRKGHIKKLVVTGCYAEIEEDTLKDKFPEVDIWMGVRDFDKIVQAVEGRPHASSPQTFLYDCASPRLISTPSSWTFVKISEGCSHQCAFCSIPLIKGPYRSRKVSSIVEEVKDLVSRGIKEINLVSQDSTYFGRDFAKEEGLTHLLHELLEVRHLEWIRVLYGYPEEISDPLLEVMQEEKICSYIDIPFQHADSAIIKKMMRGMDGKRGLQLVQKIRQKLPGASIRTALIVGFPGEGKKEFDNLKNFLKQARFDHLGVFTYSLEKRTSGYSLGDPVKESVKKRRRDQILELQAEISGDNLKQYMNHQIPILIEGCLKQDPSVLVGRSQFQAPEVDGVVFIDWEGHFPEVINTIQKVEITDSDRYDLYGTLIQ